MTYGAATHPLQTRPYRKRTLGRSITVLLFNHWRNRKNKSINYVENNKNFSSLNSIVVKRCYCTDFSLLMELI